MAINYDDLTLCPEQVGDIYFNYLAEQNWFERVNSVTGITGDEVKFVHMDVEANLIPCCTTGDGTDTVTEQIAPVECIKTEKRYCIRDLMKILGTGTRITAGQESLGRIGEIIATATIRKFVENLSTIAFQGGKVGDVTIQGYLELATDSGLNITSGNIFDAINSAYFALPLEARRMGGTIGVFVGEEVMPVYQNVLINRNLFHYNPGDERYGRETPIPGYAGVVVIPTPAMNGTNQILVTPLENMYWLTNRIADKDTYNWTYSPESDRWILRVQTLFGVAFVRPDLAITASFDRAVLQNTMISTGVTILSPLNEAGNAVAVESVAAAVAGDAVQALAPEAMSTGISESELEALKARLMREILSELNKGPENTENEVAEPRKPTRKGSKGKPKEPENPEEEIKESEPINTEDDGVL